MVVLKCQAIPKIILVLLVEEMSEPGLTMNSICYCRLLSLGRFSPRLPGTVSNGLNARQSGILKEIPQKASPKPR